MHSWMGRFNSNARNRAFNRALNGSNLTLANMSSNDRSTSVRNVGNACSIIQENQQTCQESATAHPVSLGVGIGLIANGTLADLESSASDSTHLMIDLNVPYVPNDGNSKVDGVVGFDVKEMTHELCLCGRKRKAPGSTSVNIADSESSDSNSIDLMIDLNVPYVPDDDYYEVDGAVGFDVNEVIHNQQCLCGRKRKAPDNTFLNIADSESFASDSTHLMIDLNVPYVPEEGDSEVDGAVGFDVSSFQSTHLHFPRASRVALVENSTHLTFSEQHTNFHGDISSASRNQSNAFIQPSITHMMVRDLPEYALRYQSNTVIQPSSGPVRYLRANGVGDTRTANFLTGRSTINDICPLPLLLGFGETVAADNRERLLPAAGSVREPGHRDDPIVIEDDEEDEHVDAQQGAILYVGNFSYEGLLTLQEGMGDAGTGLKKKVISELLKQHKYQSIKMNNCSDSCCVCLDTYGDEEELGKIDCGHEFHYHCIRKWLKINNTCPICKRTALTL